jgi:hypothetical protein
MNFDDPYEKARTIALVHGTADRPWLAPEDILKALDDELCLYDKARVQRIAESDAQKTGLCWLAEFISLIHVHRNTTGTFVEPKFDNNPNLPKKKITSCKLCNATKWKCPFDKYTLPSRLVIGRELAIGYWESIRKLPLISIPEQPPLHPTEETESWFVFEKDDMDYLNMVILPQALRRIEWEEKYCGLTLSTFLARYKQIIWNWWIHSGEHNRWYASWCKNNNWTMETCEDKSGLKVTLVHEDGSRESLQGVYYPGHNPDWRLKRYVEWKRIANHLKWWFDIGEQTHWGSPERRARFARWREEIARYRNGCGPEPTEDIDLGKEIPPKEDEFIDKVIAEVAHSIVDSAFKHSDEHREPLVWKVEDDEEGNE